MQIRRIVISVFALLAFSHSAFSQEAIVTALNGMVDLRLSKDGEWKSAARGASLSEGSALRTGADGRAILLFKNGTKIWVKEKTTLDLAEQKKLSNLVYLREGAVKARIPHLKFREKFRMRTATSLVAVRGTILTMEADASGQPQVDVLFGEVKLVRTDPDQENELKKAFVSQGNGYTDGKVALLTPEKEVLGLEDWSPGLTPDERRRDMIDSVKKRNEVRQFAALSRAMDREIDQSQQQVKEEDFAAGRTLVDVHGNLVRVDQRLDRPDGKTIQVLNVVKRTDYASKGFRKFTYNGSAAGRVDSIRAKIEFDQVLPDNINEFPGFFSKSEDTIHVARSELVLANSGDGDNVFTVALMGLRNAATNDISPDLFIGTLQTSGGTSGRKKLFDLRQQSDLSVPGLTRFVEDTSIASITTEGREGELYGNFAKRWYNPVSPATKFWLASEFFIINNGGQVKNVSDFIGGDTNFESLFKNSAAELGVFAKQNVGNAPGSSDETNFAGGNSTCKNIDIVFIPDIFVSVVKSMATSIDSISKSLDKSFDSVSNAKR